MKRIEQVIAGSKQNDYSFFSDDVIGKGAYGTVYKGTEVLTNQQVAIKVVGDVLFKKSKEKYTQAANRELAIFKVIGDCSNVVKMLDFVKENDYTYIILEYCDGTDLRKILNKKNRLNEDEAVSCLRDIAKGVNDLHQKNIMHRDLNLGNILVKEGKYIIADFGSAIQRKEAGDFAGAAGYTAPEIHLTNQGKRYNKQVDLWAMGVIFFKMLYGKDLFKEYEKALSEDDTKGVERFPEDSNVSKNAVDLLDKMFKIDPNERITIEGLINHRLLNKDGNNREHNNESETEVKKKGKEEVEEEKKEDLEEGRKEGEDRGEEEEEAKKEQLKGQKNKEEDNEHKAINKKNKKKNKKEKKNDNKTDPPSSHDENQDAAI